jgi:ABC-type dipeptide/oligopeptide/nickel transport system ATPase subunit
MTEPLLDVQDLQVSFATEDGLVRAVDGVSFTLDRGEVVAIVGESGSGKSVTVMTLMGLTRSPNARFGGSARLNGGDLVTASEQDLERVRGKEIAMIFQDPIASLSPVMRIGNQIAEQIRAHEKVSQAEALDRAADLMERVGIPRARERLRAYPHEFSGGMRQRVMIAMALSLSPGVLIADEPTTDLRDARPRRGGRRRRPGARDVLRTAGRAGHPGRDLLRPAAPVHLGAHGIGHAGGPRPPETAPRHPRRASFAAQDAAGLPLPAPLPARVRSLP